MSLDKICEVLIFFLILVKNRSCRYAIESPWKDDDDLVFFVPFNMGG